MVVDGVIVTALCDEAVVINAVAVTINSEAGSERDCFVDNVLVDAAVVVNDACVDDRHINGVISVSEDFWRGAIGTEDDAEGFLREESDTLDAEFSPDVFSAALSLSGSLSDEVDA
ncbi:hypothetical protein NDU88_009007 [Pleurodeles waltl]|uniref:Uncharacterized protein n=1 Tax=Pleurodeles waltl TaxID=8319 RepID=A0AAV7PQW2_PLEWA|nr:hypothetical protein NDU88_009007 [Pleurodeles waltl]